ncbi:hypothetical protein Tco_0934149 [Tanacetum coccineum]
MLPFSYLIPVVDLDLPLEEADVPSFSDDSILRGIESDRDSGEDTTSIDALPLDDSMILSEYESFYLKTCPVMVFRILEDSWFNIVEGQSNAHNFH